MFLYLSLYVIGVNNRGLSEQLRRFRRILDQ